MDMSRTERSYVVTFTANGDGPPQVDVRPGHLDTPDMTVDEAVHKLAEPVDNYL